MVSKRWQHQTHKRASIVFEQMRVAMETLSSTGKMSREDFFNEERNGYLQKLDELYGEDFQIARLLDSSDLILHATGIAVSDKFPDLRATTWLYETADAQLRELSVAPMMLSEKDSRTIRNKLDLRMTGMAPGSIRAGFKMMPKQDDLFKNEEDNSFEAVRERIKKLAMLPWHILEGEIARDVHDLFPDPVELDTALQVAHDLSPTGRRGIDEISLSVPGERPSRLSPHERFVLKKFIRKPNLENKQSGKFTGEIREFDLDKRRFHLRNVQGVGTLRCVLSKEPDRKTAKKLIGESVLVSGSYEVNRSGKPRLMLVDEVKVIEQPAQSHINYPESEN